MKGLLSYDGSFSLYFDIYFVDERVMDFVEDKMSTGTKFPTIVLPKYAIYGLLSC